MRSAAIKAPVGLLSDSRWRSLAPTTSQVYIPSAQSGRFLSCAERRNDRSLFFPVFPWCHAEVFLERPVEISPATLMPMPVQRMASRRGRREIRKISHVSTLPVSRSEGRISSTPTNREPTERISSKMPRKIVERP